MLLNDCRMRSCFDERWTITTGWTSSANHFYIPLFLISTLIFPVNNRRRSFGCLERSRWIFPGISFWRTLNNKISLAAMYNKKKLFKEVVLTKQSFDGFVNNLEQLSHIAIVSFKRALEILVPFIIVSS